MSWLGQICQPSDSSGRGLYRSVDNAASEAEETPKVFWLGSQRKSAALSHRPLEVKLIIFADLMYLHKVAFEAEAGDSNTRRKVYLRLSKIAHNVTDDQIEHNQVEHDDDNEDLYVVSDWCQQLCLPWESEGSDVLSSPTHHPPNTLCQGCNKAGEKLWTYHSRKYCERCFTERYPFDYSGSPFSKGDHLKRLQQVWSHRSFLKVFTTLLSRLGRTRRLAMLSSACVRVPDELLCHRHFHYRDLFCDVKLAKGNWDGEAIQRDTPKRSWSQRSQRSATDTDDQSARKTCLGQARSRREAKKYHPLDGLAQVDPHPPSGVHAWRCSRHRSIVVVYYTEVRGVFLDWRHKYISDLDNVRCSQVITHNCGKGDFLYLTPFAQALAENNWDLAWPSFLVNCILDLMFQFFLSWFLSPISHRGFQNATMRPNYVAVLVCVLLGTRGMINWVVWFCSRQCQSCYGQGVAGVGRDSIDVYGSIMFCIESFTCLYSCQLLDSYILRRHLPMEQTILCTNPFRLGAVIFLKWCELMLSLMNMSRVLHTLLPAWIAVTGRESIAFLTFLVALSCGTALAYYSLPIVDLLDSGFDGYLSSFLRTSRLNLLGDFDQKELAGVHEQEFEDEVQSAEFMTYHWSLQIFTLACSLLFPVIALNIYVGLLGNSYDRAKEYLPHFRGVLHSTVAARALALGRCFDWIHCSSVDLIYHRCLSWLIGTVWENAGCADEDWRPDEAGTWICIAEEWLMDDKVPVDLAHSADALTVMMAQLHDSKLCDVVDVDKKIDRLAEEVNDKFEQIAKMVGELKPGSSSRSLSRSQCI